MTSQRHSNSLLVVTVINFAAMIAVTYGFGIYLFTALAPAMMRDVGFSYYEMGVITGITQVGFLVFALCSGLVTAIFSAFTIMRFSLVMCALSLGGLYLADSVFAVGLCLTLLAGCAASVWTPMAEATQSLLRAEHQSKALGLMSSGTAYGVFANSIIINRYLEGQDWRAVWLVTFILVVALCVFTFILLAKVRAGSGHQQAAPAQARRRFSEILRSLPAGMTITVVSTMFLNGLACLPFQTYLSSFLTSEHGYSLVESATAWRTIGLVGMVSGFLMGWIGDRITIRWALMITYLSLGLSASILLQDSITPVFLFILSALFGLAFYSIFGLMPAFISRQYNGPATSIVFALGNIALGMGALSGNYIGGWVKSTTGTFYWTYLIVLSATALSACLCFFLKGRMMRRVDG